MVTNDTLSFGAVDLYKFTFPVVPVCGCVVAIAFNVSEAVTEVCWLANGLEASETVGIKVVISVGKGFNNTSAGTFVPDSVVPPIEVAIPVGNAALGEFAWDIAFTASLTKLCGISEGKYFPNDASVAALVKSAGIDCGNECNCNQHGRVKALEEYNQVVVLL